jgi:outer membrane protein OmpA-like peptidoglycan-associated protein
MKTVLRGMAVLLVAGYTAGYALDHNPLSVGTTQSRNAIGTACEAAYHNPALLGVDRAPHGGLLVLPFTNYGVGIWSDKLAISPFNVIYYGMHAAEDTSKVKLSRLITHILRRSFDIGLTDDTATVARKLTDGLKGGVSTYMGYRMSLLNFAAGSFAFDISSHVDEEFRLPSGPLLTFFSATDGLMRGKTLDFSDFRQDGMWSTDVSANLGLPVSIPALHKFFHLKYGAGGIGLKYVMGHSYLKASMKNSTIRYVAPTPGMGGNLLEVNGELTVQTAGTGLHGPWKMENPFENNYFPINGHGFAADLGGILYDEHGTLTLNFQNLGVIFWIKNVQEKTFKISKNDLDAMEIIDGIDQGGRGEAGLLRIFDRAKGEVVPTGGDTMMESSGFTTPLPMTANLGYAYRWDYSKKGYFVDYCNAGINYEQAFVNTPGHTTVPRVSAGGEAGFLYGFLPLRAGFIFGGAELIGSALGGSWNFKYFSINLAYKALGTLYFNPKRGMELAFGMGYNWGYPRQVVVLDTSHPILDHDHDGLLDSVDKCPTIPEDFDGFQDADGCPDNDNDRDALADSLDKCPNWPEDIDGFEDRDGCPDYDNEHDGIPDTLDKCLNEPEDIDGFQDADGCPDPDNDNDGIPDTLDKCINDPETFNGYKDEDGCPDTLIKPTVKEMVTLNTKLRGINFKTASAELLPSSFASLDYAVTFLQQYPLFKYEIQGHCDSRGSDDYNMVLSAARVGSVKAYLMSKGIPDTMTVAIGYGESRPIADNKTAAGRAQNRRVEFHFIETPADYASLKTQEQMFRDRIREMKIKGAAQY